MKLGTVLEHLRAERDLLDSAIQALQAIHLGPSGKRRGRAAMCPAEREVVSARMLKYWEKQRAVGPSTPGADFARGERHSSDVEESKHGPVLPFR